MEDTADFLCKILIEANAGKVERALREAALMNEEKKEYIDNPVMIEEGEKRVSLKRRGAR